MPTRPLDLEGPKPLKIKIGLETHVQPNPFFPERRSKVYPKKGNYIANQHEL